MRKLLPFALSLVALAALGAGVAFAADIPALPDGGSLVTTTGGTPPADGGGPWITIDTGQVDNWVAVIRCSSAQSSPRVRYVFTTDGGTATAANQLLDLDRTFDIPVYQRAAAKFRYLSLRGEDGGPPSCEVLKQDIP